MHRLTEFLAKESTFALALQRVHLRAHGDGASLRAADRVAAVHARWMAAARRAFAGGDPTAAELDERHGLIEELGEAVERLRGAISADENRAQSSLTWLLVVVGSGFVLLLGGVGGSALGRRARAAEARDRRERSYRDAQTEFAAAMQIVRDEAEAHDLVRRHLEGTLSDSDVVVLSRNNSADRLEAATPVAEDAPLAERLVDGVGPSGCVAVRLGRTHAATPTGRNLLRCELCGESKASTCTPLLVSGEVIGSVLVTGETALDPMETERVADTVAQASPVLGNLRNLAIAELHAATDSLTGLPNRRALNDTMRLMVAQAGRSVLPLAAIALDLDHFKRVNDLFGHEKGDDVLAAVGRLLADTVRQSDIAARFGGEEFCLLLADTDVDGAVVVAEKLRAAIGALEISGVSGRITASFGVASYPVHAADSQTLMRKADRALYAAKEAGRDRVEVASVHGAPAGVADA
jgi:diguanylate cyclase (GGDEF)-like protein